MRHDDSGSVIPRASYAEILMCETTQNLCPVCTAGWNGTLTRREIFVDAPGHETWYRCSVCGSYWVETERYAMLVPHSEVPDNVLRRAAP
jgi:translation initiation factor 2 gamma subunit (eIF-2gamma)